jgi:cytoskeletal protein CcmA (bactofilin family)
MIRKSSSKQETMFSKDSSKLHTPNPSIPASPKGGMPSIVSPDLKVQGDLMSTGDIQVEGMVNGGVFCRQVTIGGSGSVAGAAEAEIVHVSGRVEGQIRAKSVTLADTARVEGDISYETLAIEAGAQLRGRCTRRSWTAVRPAQGTQEAKTVEAPEAKDDGSRGLEAPPAEKKEAKPSEDQSP